MTKLSSFEEYIASLPGKKEYLEFESELEAYEYGNKVRANVAKENGLTEWFDYKGELSIDISGRCVRIKFKSKVEALEPACV